MRSPVAELLLDLTQALAAAQVRWFLFGAQAAAVYGSARLSADVDVTIRMPPTISGTDLVAVLRSHGFESRFTDATFVATTRVLPVVHPRTGMPIDLVMAGPGLEEQFLERARLIDIDGMAVPVASPEDLIVMKLLAGRAKDEADVRAVLAHEGSALDVGYVRTTLRQLQEALAQDDLLPAFESLLVGGRRPGDRPTW